MFDIMHMFQLIGANGFAYDYTDGQFTIVANQEVAYDEYATITFMYKAFVVRLKDGRVVYQCSWEDHPEGFVDLEYHVCTRFEINQVDQFLEQFYDTLEQEVNANE